MKLITLNQLVSSLETTKEYIDKTVGNIDTDSNIDTDNLVITNSISMGRKESTTIGEKSVAVGYEVEASSEVSHAEGMNTTASGISSHAEGFYTTASGEGSHAEGGYTTASGWASHAEGNITEASGDYSHAEGFETIASGDYSHAEGANTIASGEGSHAEGYLTIASSEYQHVQGKYNIEDTANTYAHIVGNGKQVETDEGTQAVRSNAHTLDWNGNAWFAGNVSIGDDNRRLATEKYVTDYVSKSSASNYTNTYAWIDSGGLTNVGYGILFQDGTSDSYAGNVCSIYADNSTDPYSHQFNVLGHWCVLDVNMFFDVGSTDNYWRSGYFSEGIFQTSDRNIKENIKYIRNNDVSMASEGETRKTNLTYNELYNFVKNDLELTTFNFNNSEYQHLGFIAQDLLYNADGTDNKVGQFILPPTTALTEDEIEENISKYKKKVNRELTENEKKALSTPKLTYSNTDYISVLAGALKETIKQVEELKEIVNQQQELINQLLDNK